MKTIENLLEIVQDLKIYDLEVELNLLKDRLSNQNSPITIPIVGEFSSGKTTLLNALGDNKKLETASKPTTSVIYEIYFGNEKEYAELVYENGNVEVIDDISTLKNDEFKGVEVVRIFDTSLNVPNSTILVDTPGLSSNDPKHKEALSKYLPNSDALILCTDVNQQITNSLLDFIEMNKLSHLPIYIVITKTDTKTEEEINLAKEYIRKNISLPAEQIISISAIKNELGEFYSLIENIQRNKNNIIQNILAFRINAIKDYLKTYISDLLNNLESEKSIEKEIKEQKNKLDKLLKTIDRLIIDTENRIEDVKYDTTRNFSNIIEEKLDGIIAKRDNAADSKAVGIINSVSNLVISNFQNEVRKELYLLANQRRNSDAEISLRSLESVNVEELQIAPLTYDIDIVAASNQKVKIAATGVKIAAAVAAVAATAGMASGAVASGAAAAEGATVAGGAATAIKAADTVTDVASIASNIKTSKNIAKASKAINLVSKLSEYKGKVEKQINAVNEFDNKANQIIPNNESNGFVEGIVGKLGDSVLGKPQRRRVISDYLENTLKPEFNSKLNEASFNLLKSIEHNLKEEAQLTIAQYENKLSELKELFNTEIENFNNTKEKYKNYINLLNN